MKRSDNHEQSYGQQERRQKETGEEQKGKEGRKKVQEGDQRFLNRRHSIFEQGSRDFSCRGEPGVLRSGAMSRGVENQRESFFV
jgi:hypothetical protein